MKRVRFHLSTALLLVLAGVYAYAVPYPISDVTASTTTVEGEIYLTWTSTGVAQADGYVTEYLVKYATSEIKSGDMFTDWPSTLVQNWVPLASGGTEEHLLSDFAPGVTFYFAVVAKDDVGNYGQWNSASETSGESNGNSMAAPFDAVPSQITGLTLGPGDSSMELSWAANPEIDIKSYSIERSTWSDSADFSIIAPILHPGTTHYDGSLVNGNTYYYRVRAEDMTGHEGPPMLAGTYPRVTLTQPVINAAVSGPASTTTINWSWDLISNAAGYYVISSTSGSRLSPELGPATTFWIQTGLTANTSSSLYVQAFNGLLTSDSSPRTYYTLVNPPLGLTSSVTSSSIGLAWSHNGNNPAATRYTVRRSTDGVTYDMLMDLAYSTTCQETGLSEGTSYYYKIWATNGDGVTDSGQFAYLSTATPSVPPAAVTDLSIGASWSKVTLSWTAPGDDGTTGGIVGGTYEIRYTTVGAINASNWDAVPAGYRISFATNTLPGSAETRSVFGLTNDTTYYFALRTTDESGNESDVSTTSPNTYPFNYAPGAFTLTNPATDYIYRGDVPLPLSWSEATDPDAIYGDTVTYVIQYSTSSDFSSFSSLGDRHVNWGSPDLSGGLYEDTTVYWRVRASDISGYARLSPVSYFRVNIFHTAPTSFGLVSPSSGTIIVTLTPELMWEASYDIDPGDTITYRIDYSTAVSFAAYSSLNSITSTSTVMPSLAENATYYWRVWALDGSTMTPCSTAFFFRVNAIPQDPGPFNLTTPLDEEVLSTTTVAFSWQAAVDPDPGDSVSYDLTWVSNILTSSNTVPGLTGTSTSFYVQENSIVNWSVTAVDSATHRTQSSSRRFYVNSVKQLPEPFNLIEPASNALVPSLRPSFSWSKAIDLDPTDNVRYMIDISTSPGFTGPATLTSGPQAENAYTSQTDLAPQTTYYWRVRAAGYIVYPSLVNIDGGYTFSSSTGVFFVSVTNNPPQNFSLISPANGAAVKAKTPALRWSQATDIDADSTVRYTVVISTLADLSSAVWTASGIEASSCVPATPLLEDRAYYWKVTAVDDKGTETSCQSPFSFTVLPNAPLAPSGLSGTLSPDKMKFTITWTAVSKNSDNTDIDDLAGYVICRGFITNTTNTMNAYAFVPAGTNQWTDENTGGGNYYYRVLAKDLSGLESKAEDSPVLSSLSGDKLCLISDDRSFNVEVPPEVSSYLLSANNPYKSDLSIVFEHNTAAEQGSDSVMYSYVVKILDSNGAVLNGLSLAKPLTIRFGYGTGTNAPARLAVMKAPASPGELNVYWNNGIEFMRLGGVNDSNEQQITLKTTRTGEFQLRSVSRAQAFGVASVYPPKVFTPGVAPYSEIQFTVDNPSGDKVTGKIFDLRGDFMADLRPMGDAMATSVILKWDGKTSEGEPAPKGVYLYQIEGSGKVLNGTIMVAK